MSDIVIDPARAGDLAALAFMIENCYRGDHARMGWTHEADMVSGPRLEAGELASVFTNPDAVIFVARQDDDIVGCVTVTDRPPDTAYIGMLCVDPPFQASGLGARLLKTAELLCANLGVAKARMSVVDGRDELIAWYERKGYVRTGEHEPYHAPQDRPIFFAMLEKRIDSA